MFTSTTTHLTFEEFQNLPEDEGKRYELDEGELLMTPPPTVLHNRIRDRIFLGLREFVNNQDLGEVMLEMDFRLGPMTVRRPDIAVVSSEHLQRIDVERWPVDGAPLLAVEVISPGNAAQDIARKIAQYLRFGCRSVWVVYPALHQIEIHSSTESRKIQKPSTLKDEAVVPGFSLSLALVFGDKK